jgi:RNA polymerase sigma factor (sigma-70 family)
MDGRMKRDSDLLAEAGTNAGAFRELYDRHAEGIYGYHARRVRDDQAAHDLTAETFACAWTSRERFRDEAEGSAAPWLYGIARNVLAMSARRRRLERTACDRLGLEAALESVGDGVAIDESAIDHDELLRSLPPALGDAVRLRVVEELSYDDVAGALDTTPAAARVRVHRGLALLRGRLEHRKERR